MVSVSLFFGGNNVMNEVWLESDGLEWLALMMSGAVIGYLIWDSLRTKLEK
jgi:hypothetical protein